jgi:hypothetical protein
MAKYAAATLFFWLATVSESLALGGNWGGDKGFGGSAPEIDGPAGVAAIAVLVSAGLIAYNRYKKK